VVTRELIVDGYNVLHAVPRYRALVDRDLASARDRLVNDVASFAAGAWRAAVVFDGTSQAEDSPQSDVAGVRVLYSPEGVEADTLVEELARAVRDRGGEAVVVTSDAITQQTVFGGKVVRMSAREFGAELAVESADREGHAPAARPGSALDGRIDATTRSALLRLRDRRGG
jgi:predicted RNA-binding protein with PIN domain